MFCIVWNEMGTLAQIRNNVVPNIEPSRWNLCRIIRCTGDQFEGVGKSIELQYLKWTLRWTFMPRLKLFTFQNLHCGSLSHSDAPSSHSVRLSPAGSTNSIRVSPWHWGLEVSHTLWRCEYIDMVSPLKANVQCMLQVEQMARWCVLTIEPQNIPRCVPPISNH